MDSFDEMKRELDTQLEKLRQVHKAANHTHFLEHLVAIKADINESTKQARGMYDALMKKANETRYPMLAKFAKDRAESVVRHHKESSENLLKSFMEAAPEGFRVSEDPSSDS